jgi:hypothetical protein
MLDLNDESPLNLPKRQLENELAYLVAEKMWRDLNHDITNGEVHNSGQSNYESGCHALILIGLYQQGKHYTLHKVIVPVGGMRQLCGKLGSGFKRST